MTQETILAQCPHCYGRLEFEVKPKYTLNGEMRSKGLSIVTVTTAAPRTEAFLEHMRLVADDLDAEFVVGYDTRYGNDGLTLAHKYSDLTALVKSKGYIESILQDVIDSCSGTWILRLDDDEMVSPAMWEWLRERKYNSGESQIWSFPTATLWPTTQTFISDHPFWPDVHPRLSTWKFAKWGRSPHSGALHGPGLVAPVAIAHHKLLVKTIEERRKIWKDRDEGQVRDVVHATMSVPEDNYTQLTIHPLGDGYFESPSLINGVGEVVELTKPGNSDTV